jgi:methyl-accepting chemotaxis protein
VAFVPTMVKFLGYSPEMTQVLTYVVAMTTGLILGWVFSRTLSRNIAVITSSTEAISKGDLTRQIKVRRGVFPDETQEMADSLNLMADNLRSLVRRIRDASTQVTDSAKTLSSSALEINASTEEVAQAIEQISHGAENQAELVGNSAKVIHEMAISVELVAKRAKESATAARETSTTAQRGVELAHDSLELTKNFFAEMEQSGRQFSQLNSKLQQVGKIADVIAEIARQTNMLALNASIEAVRAGEFGKGFAVVAEEVRKLADSSSKSAGDIIELIGVLKDESQKVYGSFAESGRHIKEGKKNLDNTASAFQAILQTVLETERKANSIADLSHLQTDGAKKMVLAIDEIAKVAEDNAASTEQVSAATEEQSAAMQEMVLASKELAELADALLQSVAKFSIPEPEISAG